MVSSLVGGAIGGGLVTITIRAVDKFSKTFDTAQKSMAKAGTAITAVGVAAGAAVGGLVKMAGQFEQTQIAFTTMLGSAEEANKLLKELADFAARTPFTIPGIEKNAKLLLGMGVAAEDMIPTLKALGDVSAGLSVPLDRIALNFGQIRVQGKLTGRELRDFAVAGVPLIAELAKNFNLTEKAIAEMVSRGEIGFKDVEKAFVTMTSKGGRFFDLMDAQSKTFLGQVSNIEDSFTKVAREMGQVFLPAAKAVAERLAIIIEWFERHPTIAKFTAIFIGVTAAIALILGPLLILVALLPLLAAGFGILSVSVLPVLLPILGIVAGITALIIGIKILLKKWDDLGKRTKILITIFAPFLALPVLIIKNWGKISSFFIKLGNVIITVWNVILTVIQGAVNGVITAINFLIRGLNKIPGFNIGLIGKLDLSGFKGALLGQDLGSELSTSSKSATTIVNIENLNGMDPEEISRALSDELNEKVSL